jgi:uncharacterized protein YqhQ
MTKKSIYELREEFIRAEHQLEVLHIYGDHIVIVLPYNMTNIEAKKLQLKEHIQNAFTGILNVDLFTQYIVVWHDHELLCQSHLRIKRPS